MKSLFCGTVVVTGMYGAVVKLSVKGKALEK